MRTSNRRPANRQDSRRPNRPLPARRPGPQDWFAHRLLLILSGQRPVHTLLGHVREHAYEQLIGLAPHTPLRPAPGENGTLALRAVGVCRPSPDAIEAFARITSGPRTRAFAFRLERIDARWQCVAIELDTVP
ncbi:MULTISPECIES: Rv3235 family protein [unclassified Streptomyces]|uniref:Rv3235 family protein n=1 Tax=Streptomyces millisiae TaxID=3075542 RepID=A0ABU2LXF6_9ACTN|nr:Rv3235 family protein [Streptomyces sp. DSM 44918]MDT0322277.1 Rv3235 family protein [Streptomyces sp. DSM 44918]